MDELQVKLPWPPKELSPNARVHWATRSRVARKYRQICHIITRQAGIKIEWDGQIHAWIDFYPPDRRHRDDDNLVSSFKPGRDGMADALGINDKRIRIHPRIMNEVGGHVIVTLSEGMY